MAHRCWPPTSSQPLESHFSRPCPSRPSQPQLVVPFSRSRSDHSGARPSLSYAPPSVRNTVDTSCCHYGDPTQALHRARAGTADTVSAPQPQCPMWVIRKRNGGDTAEFDLIIRADSDPAIRRLGWWLCWGWSVSSSTAAARKSVRRRHQIWRGGRDAYVISPPSAAWKRLASSGHRPAEVPGYDLMTSWCLSGHSPSTPGLNQIAGPRPTVMSTMFTL